MEDIKNEKEHLQLQFELKEIKSQIEADNKVITAQLELILQTTSGVTQRIDNLEKEFATFKSSVDFVTVISKRKWLLIVIIAGVYFIFKNFDIVSWAKKIF